ncbi:MAG: F0F1 ATP synthase subunit A [Sporichthyaceae bacterium]|nr:F0F1 ATP synthase subunit A [Sporichthyaceae bacterium]
MRRAGIGDALHLVNVAQAAEGEEFHAPGPGDFEFPPLFGEGTFFTKPMLVIVLGSLLIAGLFYLASRRASLVPAKMQFVGESVYGFVRNGIVGDTIGHDGRKFVPYLTTLFCFIAVLNLSGIIPVLQLPATSKIAIPLFLALISWVVFNYVGIRRHGFLGYFKNMMFPPGLPKPIYLLLAPLELFSTVIIRPITLTLRLTLNMFAGHLVLLLTVLGGEYLLVEKGGLLAVASVIPFAFSIILTFFEAFVQVLQAYVFVLLTALYIAGALAEEH